ncbi:peroxisomal membrane protein PMP34 isoform X1 [Hylaeus volcanicus]|uniref:peroxisomal membrane protein PMP34 isoform X1 n=1 Tax=Hylaeus volcanicus TaxID=313075 RepID=UPI0023B83B3A|nr:peroxisomal membrane protein PMP34 isoform X1 [Hylaeus volcanicus]XP_053995093.1 peroxisomal membrane protein PMP34 isoform X1 [Hylaeus volcanicus]XP_053995094.1 peroxisomal membrane protein PMP34 isoform X1 [Hylaeus volcanicus]XP_053995095.1 peroxisomal membrane protein PMP34 isoform X1 [Hylaeus volcanicus]XP_053995096.1 peroxisomal membrane protein PMP34 isoform X1 [Hylaeus volcanicus]
MGGGTYNRSVFTYETLVHAISGAAGSVVAMATFFPLDTVRSRLQRFASSIFSFLRPIGNASTMHSLYRQLYNSRAFLLFFIVEDGRDSKNTLAMIRELTEKEGPYTLYRGMVPVLQSLCASNFVYFYTFHGLKMLRTRRNQTAGNDLLVASIAGVINVLTTTPLWVVNTRLKMRGIGQTPERNNNEYNTLYDGLIHIWKYEGLRNLWAGTLPSLMLVMNPAIQFMTYESIKRRISASMGGSQPPAWMFFAIGAIAKTIATGLTYPLQLVQSKLRHGHKYPTLPPNAGTLEILLYILKKQGIAGLYKGMEAKLLQTVLTAALMFLAYENISRFVFRVLLHRPILR